MREPEHPKTSVAAKSASALAVERNIRHVLNMLLSNIPREVRSQLHELLAKELDKLARNSDLLGNIEKYIADVNRRMEAPPHIRKTKANRHDPKAQIEVFLEGMMESRNFLMKYHQSVLTEIDRNSLPTE